MPTKVRPIPKPRKARHFLREWRKYRQLTQERLAERISVTPGTISQLENGQISYTLYGLGLFLLALTVVGLVVVYPLALALLALVLWNMVRGALAAGRGEVYRYAFILRLVP